MEDLKKGPSPDEAKKADTPKQPEDKPKAEAPKFEKPKPKPGQLLMVHKTRKDKNKNPLYRSVTQAEVEAFEKNGFILDPATAVKK